ncbi:MAG: ADP-ribosylation factor-like protein [Candidatus Helarchaeota archaeon]
MEQIPDLNVRVIQGVGDKIAKTLESLGIDTVKDLASIDVLEVSKKTKIPQHILIEFRKKARLLRELIFDYEVINKLTDEKYTIQDLLEMSVDKLVELTGIDSEKAVQFLDKATIFSIVMDASYCKQLSIDKVQTKPYIKETNELEKLVDITKVDEMSSKILEELPPKIALIGFSGTGKTTIGNLIQNEEFPKTHLPTMTLDIDNIVIGGLNNCILFDCAGQEQFSFLWERFVKNSDAIILVVDSQEDNVKKSIFFVEQISKYTPKTPFAIIANKQDLPNALSPEQVSEILGGYRTEGLVAIERENREKVLNLLADLLKLSPELKNLIPEQIKTDTIIKEAEIVTQYSESVVKEIKAIEKEISKIEDEIKELKLKLKEDLTEEEARKLRIKLVVAKAKLRNKQNEIKEIKLRSDTCCCLSYDVHQGMRNVSYIIQCKCGHIYRKLYEIDRGTERVVLICPKCGTEYEPDESTWSELKLGSLK